jgi:hypothetical protein
MRRNYFVPRPQRRFPTVLTQRAEGGQKAGTRIGNVKTGASIASSSARDQKKSI